MAESNEMLGQGCGCYIQAHGTWIVNILEERKQGEKLGSEEGERAIEEAIERDAVNGLLA